MKLSLELIEESLSVFGARMTKRDGRVREFTGVQILTDPDGALCPDSLYVCAAERLPDVCGGGAPDVCFVTDGPLPEGVNGIRVDPGSAPADVTNHLIQLFAQFNRFEFRMKEAALLRKGYGPFFELAARVFPHCLLVVTDSAYNLVFMSRDHVQGNDYFNALLSRGYYCRDDLTLIGNFGYFDDERKYAGPVLYPADKTLCNCPFLVKSYRSNGTAFSFVGCYFIDAGPTLADIARFTCFTRELDTYYEVNGIYSEGLLSSQQQLIEDLIQQKQDNPDFIRDRCRRLHIPYSGEFRIGLLCADGMSPLRMSQTVNLLKAHCPVACYGVFQYGAEAVILLRDWNGATVKDSATLEDDWAELAATLRQSRTYMGVSLVFYDASGIRTAYTQARTAAELGHAREPETVRFFYSDYFITDMLRTYADRLPLADCYTKYLDRLNENTGSACGNLELLHCYLCAERNISLTASRVHMHRNSVIYRIQKIEDILALDLDDPGVRMRLLLSYKILELSKRIPVWETGASGGMQQKE